jgi:hypothetical protein
VPFFLVAAMVYAAKRAQNAPSAMAAAQAFDDAKVFIEETKRRL